nr:amino acid-binding protein [Halobellus ruber]
MRLELVDEPGELLRALRPVADHGGNLLSIFHERGNVTPRGHIPVEVDVEATPDRFERIIDDLREAGINVIQAGTERYSEEVTVVLSGHVIETDLSDTLSRIRGSTTATVTDLAVAATEGTADVSSARLGISAEAGTIEGVLELLRTVAAEKDLELIEPLPGGSRG